MSFLNYLISGISLGSIYAIIALGYTMVYGIAKMLNFAHGDVIMVGAYVCFFAASKYNLPPIVGVLLAMLVCTVLGMVIEKLAYKPLRQATSLAVLITAIGVCLIIMVVLLLFINRTKMGKAMRACSEDKGAAQLMGINVDATISVTFAIGSGLAAVAGVLLCSAYPTLVPTTGSMPGIKAFTAAVFGGIGSISGLMRSKGGRIEFMGKNISAMAPHKIVELGIAHVPEGRRIFTSMTVEENLDMGAYTAPAADLQLVYTLRFPNLKVVRLSDSP